VKINLGCGTDIKNGYVNVDFRGDIHPSIVVADLEKFPWQWGDETIEEVLMYDFFEHFPYRMTKPILEEVWRILKLDGKVEIQVPDFNQCARAILGLSPYVCNVCETNITFQMGDSENCDSCGTSIDSIADAGVRRLYGGQNYPGNFHQTTFTPKILERHLGNVGFGNFEYLEKEHQLRNWNFKVRATKVDPWRD
jgi:hypothetical protein